MDAPRPPRRSCSTRKPRHTHPHWIHNQRSRNPPVTCRTIFSRQVGVVRGSAGVVCRGKNIQRTRYTRRSCLQISRDQATRMPPLTSSFAYPGYANAANTVPRGLRQHTTRTGPQTDENNLFRRVLSTEFRPTPYASSPNTLPKSCSERSTVAVVLPREEQGSCYSPSLSWDKTCVAGNVCTQAALSGLGNPMGRRRAWSRLI